MLIIRREQLSVLAAPLREQFVDKVVESLAKVFPGDARLADAEKTRKTITDAIVTAEAYGIDTPREVSLYAFLVHEYGFGFESQPDKLWIAKVLGDAALPPPARLDVVYARLEAASAGSAR